MISSGSKLAEDIRYGLAHWEGLTRFLDDGRLELDTNPVENAIRPVCLTRKNALFAGHEVGAENWALLSSIVATCRLNDVNPVAYLAETLDGHHQRPSAEPDRGPHALALPEVVKPRSVGDRQSASSSTTCSRGTGNPRQARRRSSVSMGAERQLTIDVRQAAHELTARYLVEGSVRQAGERPPRRYLGRASFHLGEHKVLGRERQRSHPGQPNRAVAAEVRQVDQRALGVEVGRERTRLTDGL